MREMGYLSNQPRRVSHRAFPSDDIRKLEGIRVGIWKLEGIRVDIWELEGIRVDICKSEGIRVDMWKLREFNEWIQNGKPSLQNAFRATIPSANL